MFELLFHAGVWCKFYTTKPENSLPKRLNCDWNLNISVLVPRCQWTQHWKLTQALSLLQEMFLYMKPGNGCKSGKLYWRIYNPREFCISKTCYKRLFLCKTLLYQALDTTSSFQLISPSFNQFPVATWWKFWLPPWLTPYCRGISTAVSSDRCCTP